MQQGASYLKTSLAAGGADCDGSHQLLICQTSCRARLAAAHHTGAPSNLCLPHSRCKCGDQGILLLLRAGFAIEAALQLNSAESWLMARSRSSCNCMLAIPPLNTAVKLFDRVNTRSMPQLLTISGCEVASGVGQALQGRGSWYTLFQPTQPLNITISAGRYVFDAVA